jgi:hypothetical protein
MREDSQKKENRKAFVMKTTTIMAALAGMAMFAFAGPAHAQFKSTTDDGIAASPKLRERLSEYARNHRPAAAPAEAVQMACPKCKDTWVKQTDLNPKGLGARTLMGETTKLISEHLCDGCGTHWQVTGHGKATQSVASHTCTESKTQCNMASK